MQLIVTRNSLKIVPETPIDEAFLEEVLGLKQAGDIAFATRVSAMGLPRVWAYLEIMPRVITTKGMTGLWEPTSGPTQEPHTDQPPAKAEPVSPTSNPPTQNEPASSPGFQSLQAIYEKSLNRRLPD